MKKALKHILLPTAICITLSSCGTGSSSNNQPPANPAQNNTPNSTYDSILPANNPTDDVTKYPTSSQVSQLSATTGSNTYTYVRCYYAKNQQDFANMTQLSPTSDYVWAENSDGSYYKLGGYWYSDSIFAWHNWFFTSVTKTDISNICNQSVQQQIGSNYSSFYQVAADNSLSFNHTIWQNDDNNTNSQSINKIIAFGDSLSDNNNMYNLSQWKIPNKSTWFQGRFSNGLNWVEYVAQDLAIPLYDLAVGGAGVSTADYVIPSLGTQISTWLSYVSSAQNYEPQKTLATIFIGGNDFISYNKSVSDEISAVQSAITTLAQNNVGHILIMNLPDLTHAPLYTLSGNSNAGVLDKTLQYNQQLIQVAAQIQQNYPNTQIKIFDTKSFMDNVFANPSAYGFTNTTDGCTNIANGNSALYFATSQAVQSGCTDPRQYIFWDKIHPTTKTHRILSQAVSAFIQSNMVN